MEEIIRSVERTSDTSLVCPHCGGHHVEVNTEKPGDYPWMLCADCGWMWE